MIKNPYNEIIENSAWGEMVIVSFGIPPGERW